MRRIVLLAVLLLSTQAAEAEYLYKMTMVRAAPGKLLELIDLFDKRMSVYETSGDEAPLRMRHAQGDQWDLLIMYPIESFSKYYAPERVAQRTKAATASGLSEEEFNRLYYEYSSFHEDMIVKGPPLQELRKAFGEAGYLDSQNPKYHYFGAIALQRGDKYKEAERTLQRAIRLEPFNADYLAEAGHIYISLGFANRARTSFEKAMQIAPMHKRAMEGLSKLPADG